MITIIIVVKNAFNDISCAIESYQKYRSNTSKLIVLDGNSNDGTLEVIGKYKALIDVLISEPDRGIYDAMNKALRLVSEGWILFLGADDELCCNLEIIENNLLNNNTVYYGNVKIKENNKLLSNHFNKLSLARKNVCHQAILYPASTFSKKYNNRYNAYADWVYNMELSKEKYKFSYLNLTISIFSIKGKSCKGDKYFAEDYTYLVRKNLGVMPSIYGSSCLFISKLKMYIKNG